MGSIDYHYETDFILNLETNYTHWINRMLTYERATLHRLDYIFCDDTYLLEINQRYLQHDSYTDIITFDYSEGTHLCADIFISTQRVADNAKGFGVEFNRELLRVMAHGVLHLLGYNDKNEEETGIMRGKENEMMELFHVEH